MAIRSSTAVSTSSAAARMARAEEMNKLAAQNGQLVMSLNANSGIDTQANGDGTTPKTPDYHLPWTGEVVEETLRKMMDFDPDQAGGVTVLPSTEGAPAQIDEVLDAGNYTANYMTSTLSVFPPDLTDVSPINLVVYEKDGIIYQMIEGMGDRYTRFTEDNGASWSVWSPKSTTSGGINTGDPETPAEDPIEDIQDRLEQLETSLGASVTVGTAEQATAMLEGKYDWDTGEITPGA